jgi:UDP-2,3-diacylglucosamine pyrophosphatase LpxH
MEKMPACVRKKGGSFMGEEVPLPEKQSSVLSETESIIVVSDLHLGGGIDPDTKNRFCRFVDAIARIKPGTPSDDSSGFSTGHAMKYLRKPKKIILLGDILELWDARNQNRDNVFFDAAVPFAKLQEMDADVLYVTGNHDENIGDIIDADKGCARKESCDFVTRGTKKFSIFKRSYTPNENRGVNVDGIYYAFLHGHQFDPEQFTYTISKCTGARFDPVGYIADIANNYVAKSIPPLIYWVILITWALLVGVYFSLPGSPVMTLLTFIIWGIAVVLLLYNWYVFRSTCKKKLEPARIPSAEKIASVNAGAAIFIVALLLLGIWFSSVYFILFTIILAVYSYFFAVVAVPKVFEFLQRDVYNWWTREKKVKNKTPTEVIKGNFERKKGSYTFFDPKKYTMKANVVVFGHTHCAGRPIHVASDRFEKNYEGPSVVYFYNTGCWENDSNKPKRKDDECSPVDTFVYIDTDGIFLLKWDDAEGRILYRMHHSAQQIRSGIHT